MAAESKGRDKKRPALRGCLPENAQRPAGDVMASIAWEGPADPRTTSAERFLSSILG
jgi:hypothetical protein